MVALKLNKFIIPMCSITLLIISCVSLIEFSNTTNTPFYTLGAILDFPKVTCL